MRVLIQVQMCVMYPSIILVITVMTRDLARDVGRNFQAAKAECGMVTGNHFTHCMEKHSYASNISSARLKSKGLARTFKRH